MCGIAGAIDLIGEREFPRRRLLSMTGAIARRGPDDEQTYQEPGLALGVRRLSVVDLEGGRQPIANESGNVWVAYNGELYEYPELRKDLLARGHTLATRCDTEAWVHLYEDRGEGMFEKTRGDFAVALWDRTKRTLILGRDRIGVCPLYYAERDGWLLFGSEVKALLASGLVAATPDPQGDRPLLPLLLRGDDADVLRRGEVAAARPLPAHQRGPGRAEEVLGPRLPRRRRGAADEGPDAPGGRAGTRAHGGRRAPPNRRRAGRQLHQRRARLDGHAGPDEAP